MMVWCDAGGVLCGTLGQTTQRHSVSDAPLAAVISLKRFQHVQTIVGQVAEGSELVCTRLCKAISYSPAFQIPLTDGSYSQYDVDAIVCHVPDKKRPSAGDRGHYVAFVVRTGADGTRRYYKMDDRRRTEVDEATFLAQQENVFMLFGSLSGQSNDPMLISETIATSRSVAVEVRQGSRKLNHEKPPRRLNRSRGRKEVTDTSPPCGGEVFEFSDSPAASLGSGTGASSRSGEEKTATSGSEEETATSGEIHVQTLGDNDVLCGKGVRNHEGNVRYRSLVQSHRDEYRLAARFKKSAVAASIVATIHSRGGRFLSKCNDGRPGWTVIGQNKSQVKTYTALGIAATAADVDPTKKRGRGRPKGSKNKPKPPSQDAATADGKRNAARTIQRAIRARLLDSMTLPVSM